MYKNIEKTKVLTLNDQVEYQKGQVVSKTLVQNELVSMTIFSFDKGEEISSHAADGDAMVTVLEGKVDSQLAEKYLFLTKVKQSLCLKVFLTLFMVKKSLRCF